MTQRSMFFDAISSDRQYDATSFAALLQSLVQRDGVVYGYGSGLSVTATGGMTAGVLPGVAFVQGRMFEAYNSGETLTIVAANATNPRIDRIVVRLDLSTGVRSAVLAVKTGVAQASPVAPTLTRDVSIWELSLAQVLVGAGVTSIVAGNITDERNDDSVCGRTMLSVESGSNANGSYIKFPDGTMICRYTSASLTCNTAFGAVFRSDATTWTFPAAFKTGTVPDVSAVGTGWCWAMGPNAPTAGSVGLALVSYATAQPGTVSAIAIGKWK